MSPGPPKGFIWGRVGGREEGGGGRGGPVPTGGLGERSMKSMKSMKSMFPRFRGGSESDDFQ